MAPKSAPGKKPAATALLGKDGHVDVSGLFEPEFSLETDAEGEGTGMNVAPDAEEFVGCDNVAAVVGFVVELFLLKTHVWFP